MITSKRYFTSWRILTLTMGIVIILICMQRFGPGRSLDAMFYYNYDEAKLLFESLNQEEVKKYLLTEFLDLGLILFYSLFLYISFTKLFKNIIFIRYLGLIPGVFDFIETKSIILILNQSIDYSILYWLGMATAAKWSMGAVCALLLITGLVLRLRPFRLSQEESP